MIVKEFRYFFDLAEFGCKFSRMRIFGSLWVFVLSLASVTAEAAQWRLSGSLNYVHPALNEQFQVDDIYTLTVEVDEGAQPIGIDRRFFDSVGRFDDAILGGSLEFENGYVMELKAPTGGSFNIVNADSASTSGFDQLNLSFQTFDESLIGEPVAGNDPANLSVSFTDEEPPFDMLKGTDAAFPDFDLPFPNPQTFFLEQSTNERFHLRLQFTGGQPEGTQFVRGSISDFTFAAEVDLPGGQAPVESNLVSNLSIVPDGTGRLVLSWDGSGVAPVVVERSGDLLSWEPWVTVPAGAEQEVSIDLQLAAGAWFYRLIASAPEPPDVPAPSIPTPSIRTGSYEVLFDWEITVAEEGELVVADGATMQATLPEDETLGDVGQETVKVDLDGGRRTIQLSFEDEAFDEAELVHDSQRGGYSFEMRVEEERSPIWGRSGFYEESTEVIRGYYQPLTGKITMDWEDLNLLSWDIDSRTSLLRSVWSLSGNIDP